ncbi:MAG TPA: hypothetical protein PKJ63_07230 [Cyclobacteriaceae bacterium]|nr:hypothetical protein [Cyclobacteriaceae bacterium]
MNKDTLKLIAKAGLITGTLDGLSASIQYVIVTGNNPILVFQYISSAVFGQEAFSSAGMYGPLGIVFHYIIATGWSTLFIMAYPRVSLLRRNVAITAVIYGIFVWCMMNLVIVPMTRIPARPFNITSAAIAAGILVVAIGLPLAIIGKKSLQGKQ